MTRTYTCKTIGGPSGWNDTWTFQFPFSYSGDVLTEFANSKGDNDVLYSWCSTKVEGENRAHVGRNWGICSTECACTTIGGPKGWRAGDKCQFPFKCLEDVHNGCVEEYSIKNTKAKVRTKGSWCSTKVHSANRSHIKGHWGKCSTGCPIQARKHILPCNGSQNETNKKLAPYMNNCSNKNNTGKGFFNLFNVVFFNLYSSV